MKEKNARRKSSMMIKPKVTRNTILSLLITAIIFCLALLYVAPAITDALADTFAVPCTIDTYGDAWDGYLAFGLWEYDSTYGYTQINNYLVIMKTNGDLVNFRKTSPSWNYLIVKEMSEDTLMYQGEPNQAVHFWNLTTNETIDFENVFGHHDVEYNPITETFLTLRSYIREINGKQILFDRIVELNSTGQTLWTWDTYNYLNLEDACPFNDIDFESGASDFSHSNALQWNYDENTIYLNVRNLNTFYAINQTSGELIWSCGEHGDFKLFDINGTEVSSLWYHGHALKEVEENVFIIFDNDYHNQTNPENAHSRILEVTIDEENMTAWESWSWAAPKGYWSQFWGDADRLPNGNRIGVFGTQVKQYNSNIGAVLVEVNPEGQVVRTYTFPRSWGIYRVEELISLVPPPTPTPSATPTPTPSPTPVATPTPTPSPTPVATPTPTPSPTPVATPTPTPSQEPTSPTPEPPQSDLFPIALLTAGAISAAVIGAGLLIYFKKRKR